MTLRRRFAAFDHKVRLRGDAELHEQTDTWSNRDLIPLPPARRTWGWFNYYGFWAIGSLNIANWQTPSTFLSTQTRIGSTTKFRTDATSYGLVGPAGHAYHRDR